MTCQVVAAERRVGIAAAPGHWNRDYGPMSTVPEERKPMAESDSGRLV